MEKFILLFIYLFIFSLLSPVFADGGAPSDNSNWGVPAPPSGQFPGNPSPSQNVWDEERNNIIEKNYGSETSPAYLNREKINPYEDGNDSDSTDSE